MDSFIVWTYKWNECKYIKFLLSVKMGKRDRIYHTTPNKEKTTRQKYKRQEFLRYWSALMNCEMWKAGKKTKASPGILPAYRLEKSSKTQHSEGAPRQRELGDQGSESSLGGESGRGETSEDLQRVSSDQCLSVWKLPEARVRPTRSDGRKNPQTWISLARVKSSPRKKTLHKKE